MKKKWLLWIILLSFSVFAQSQYLNTDEETQSQFGNCTSIMVGRLVTTDGSVIYFAHLRWFLQNMA